MSFLGQCWKYTVKICEKYKISSMFLISRINFFENTSILWINATWMNMIALKCIFKNHSQITKTEQCPNYSWHKNCTAYFPSEHHFRPYIFNITCRFRILDILSFLKKYSYVWLWGDPQGAYLAHVVGGLPISLINSPNWSQICSQIRPPSRPPHDPHSQTMSSRIPGGILPCMIATLYWTCNLYTATAHSWMRHTVFGATRQIRTPQERTDWGKTESMVNCEIL